MNMTYRTPNAFFVSSSGQRLQKSIKSFFAQTNIQGLQSVLIGPVFPFLETFNQNHPDIVFERETFDENNFFSSLPPPCSIDIVFIAALNNQISDNMALLAKEAVRLLKPQGHLFLLNKNKKRFISLNVNEMPDTNPLFYLTILKENGFLLQKKKDFLYFPYNSDFWKKAERVFSFIPAVNGAFSLTHAQKNLMVSTRIENYNSTRMTNASVLTSPRT